MFRHRQAPARAHDSTGTPPSALVGFLSVNRSVLAITATAFVFAAVGIHEMPAQAATQEVAAVTQGQHLTLAAGTAIPTVSSRDAFSVISYSVVQWPVNPASPISSPFGRRVAPCAGCSTMHRGVDFTPGEGTPIAAIADGVVTEIGNPSGELGVYVIVRHDIDGVEVSSVYGHMRLGSMHLHVGDAVTGGEQVGLVGDTGESTGPHLHFGILDAGGTPISPLTWMAAHVNQAWGAGGTGSAG